MNGEILIYSLVSIHLKPKCVGCIAKTTGLAVLFQRFQRGNCSLGMETAYGKCFFITLRLWLCLTFENMHGKIFSVQVNDGTVLQTDAQHTAYITYAHTCVTPPPPFFLFYIIVQFCTCFMDASPLSLPPSISLSFSSQPLFLPLTALTCFSLWVPNVPKKHGVLI